MKFRAISLCLAVCAAAFLPAMPAAAQDPVHLIVPYGPGGSTDIAARLIATGLGTMWDTTVIVENRPAAAGTIASRDLTTMPPDGKTLLFVTSSHAINALMYDNRAIRYAR
jgi:tripartite-type tricarboxylate transporter receptor subunit TctC